MRNFLSVPVVAVGLCLFSACNAFSPIDHPSGDEQVLSSARACFDNGDLQCAIDQYNKLPGSDAAISEKAITILDQNGVTVALFAQALTTAGGASTIINTLVNGMAGTSGTAKRAALLAAYTPIDNIKNTQLKGFTRFVVGLSLAGEILAEINTVQTTQNLHKSDLVTTPAGCATATDLSTACTIGKAACAIPAASNMTQGQGGAANSAVQGQSFLLGSTFQLSGVPSLWMFYNSIRAMNQGLQEMAVTGGSSFTLVNSILNATPTADPSVQNGQCVNALLVTTLGIGI